MRTNNKIKVEVSVTIKKVVEVYSNENREAIEVVQDMCDTRNVFTLEDVKEAMAFPKINIAVDKSEIADISADESEDCIRRCDHCGKPMKEGYFLGGEYACSDECCLSLYDGDEKLMNEELSHAEEDDSECFWTEWDNYCY